MASLVELFGEVIGEKPWTERNLSVMRHIISIYDIELTTENARSLWLIAGLCDVFEEQDGWRYAKEGVWSCVGCRRCYGDRRQRCYAWGCPYNPKNDPSSVDSVTPSSVEPS